MSHVRRLFALTVVATFLAGCGATPMRRNVSEVWRDEKIKTALHWRMARDKQVKGSGVNVDVYRGVVTLGGRVTNAGERQRAEDLARRTRGVVMVENHLAVMDGQDPRFAVANRKAVAPKSTTVAPVVPVTIRTPKVPQVRPVLGSEEAEYADLAPEPKPTTAVKAARAAPTAPTKDAKPTAKAAPTAAKPAPTVAKPIIDPTKPTATRYLDAGALPPARQVNAKPQSVTDPSPAWLANRSGTAPVPAAAPRPALAKPAPVPERAAAAAPAAVAGQDDLAREAAEELKKLKAMP